MFLFVAVASVLIGVVAVNSIAWLAIEKKWPTKIDRNMSGRYY